MRSAVLFLAFNRPHLTEKSFATIRAAQPPRLYIALDGPRPDHPDDAARCQAVRDIVSAIDWPCQTATLFRSANLGCGIAVSEALDWFFSHEEEGIVIEDDILPLPCLFDYCDELLERYRDDPRIGLIAGSNLGACRYTAADSYFYSTYIQAWAWASWRRVWQRHDFTMRAWPDWRDQGGLQRVLPANDHLRHYWRQKLDETHTGLINTWDYQVQFQVWQQGLLSITPARHLHSNIGFGPDATHTNCDEPLCVRESRPEPLDFPLRHPQAVIVDLRAEKSHIRHVLNIPDDNPLMRLLRRTPAGPLLSRLRARLGRIIRTT